MSVTKLEIRTPRHVVERLLSQQVLHAWCILLNPPVHPDVRRLAERTLSRASRQLALMQEQTYVQ